MKRSLLLPALFALFAPATWATAPKVEWGGFLDTNYAYDGNDPARHARLYSTNPSRHNEFNVNLAFVEAKVTGDKVHGRLALQAGSSVLVNYSAEPRTASGPQLADMVQYIQEAFGGYQVTPGLWVDAGIFFSHIGFEGFISRDNWTYTRSIVADFSPYYQAGVRLGYAPNPNWTFELYVLNGWQNVIDNNSDKTLGTRVSYHPSTKLTVMHNTLIGRETEMRIFQDFGIQYEVTPSWQLGVVADLGLQQTAAGGAFQSWGGVTVVNRLRLKEGLYVAGRVEAFSDPRGIVQSTGTPNGFQLLGASVNLDSQLTENLLWRNELRFLQAQDAIFPAGSGLRSGTVFGVTSFALTL